MLEGRVTHVADGDSLSVCIEHREVRIRLVKIDAPEYQQAFGVESRKSLAEMCEDQQARVEITVPTQATRTQVLTAQPIYASTFALVPLPNQPFAANVLA